MNEPRADAQDSKPWQVTTPLPLGSPSQSPATLDDVVRRYREAVAAAPAEDPLKGLEVSEIDSDSTFDRLFGPGPADGKA